MKTTLLSITMLIIFLFGSITYSQNLKHKYATKGTWEFGGEIFFTSTTTDYKYISSHGIEYSNNFTTKYLAISANGGYFIINGLKLGIEPGVEITNYYSSYTQTFLKLYFTPEYVFTTKTILYPYISGSIGYTSQNPFYDQTANGLSWGAAAGLKINIAGNSLLNIGLRYFEERYNLTFSPNSEPLVTIETKDKVKQLGLTAGWSVFF